MHIRHLTAFIVRLPLKRPFAHASATRDESESVLIRCELADGTVGWGEGVPRSYVTGESPQGCLDQLAATPIAAQLAADCGDWPAVIALCERLTPASMRDDARGHYGNSLRCAVELSILDAFGRLFGEPVSAVPRHYPPARQLLARTPDRPVYYSFVIGAGNRRLPRQALTCRLYGFRHCKVKVGAAGDDDAARLRTIRRFMGSRIAMRIDANEAWHTNELLQRLAPLANYASEVEQPLPHAEISALSELRPQLPMLVILDESLTSEADARAAIEMRLCDRFNLRLSKCGGYLACLRLAAIARAAGSLGSPTGPIGIQLGCHPGESSILSAAGRHWACAVDDVTYVEGSYDRHLFKRLLTNQDISFGFRGRGPALAGPGLGVSIDPQVLQEVTVSEQAFPIG